TLCRPTPLCPTLRLRVAGLYPPSWRRPSRRKTTTFLARADFGLAFDFDFQLV
ncbi:hypothetical protein K438DRAFT_1875696, partial [Mycena galopus ATCC 62051]